MDVASLIDLETKSARISATLDHRPELSAIWRQCVALSEAGANLSLEDIPAREADILSLILGLQVTAEDPQAPRIAHEIRAAILAPGHLMKTPALVFDRAHRAGRLSSLVDVHLGGRASFPTVSQDSDWTEARHFFIKSVPKILRSKGPISLKSLAVSSLLSAISPERHPIAERIIMMAAESYLRQDLVLRDPIVAPAYSQISTSNHAHWTFLPSVALSTGSFRAWSPITSKGQGDIINGLSMTMQREAGRIGQIQSWIDRTKDVFQPKRKAPRQERMATLCQTSLVLNNETVRTALDCKTSTARNLLLQAQEAGIIKPITTRKSYNVWAIPALHDLLQERVGSVELRRQARFHTPLEHLTPALKGQPRTTMDFENKLDDILTGLDRVMEATDRALEKYVSKKAGFQDN